MLYFPHNLLNNKHTFSFMLIFKSIVFNRVNTPLQFVKGTLVLQMELG